MFDFFNDLFCELKKSEYRYQVDSGKQIVIEGYKNILRIEEGCVILKLQNGELQIFGNYLKVKELSSNTIKIIGKIKSISEDCVDEK